MVGRLDRRRFMRAGWQAKILWSEPSETSKPNMELPTAYLKERITPEAVELRYDFVNMCAKLREDWKRLLEKAAGGDELWIFEAAAKCDSRLGDLVRTGRVLSTLVEAVD